MPYHVLHGACSDIGRRRTHNEDCYLADPTLQLFVVCDGMGGENAGEIASALAMESIRTRLHEGMVGIAACFEARTSSASDRLADAIRYANDRILSAAASRPEWSGMGTTVVAALIHNGGVLFAHVGDSRLYLIRQGTIHPLTVDHSWVAEQVRQGLLSEQEAEQSPRRHIITRALGIGPQIDITVGSLPLMAEDRLLLCSDGLTRGVSAARILACASNTEEVDLPTRRLVALANDAGGEDNTTVILVAIREQSPAGVWQRLRQRLAG